MPCNLKALFEKTVNNTAAEINNWTTRIGYDGWTFRANQTPHYKTRRNTMTIDIDYKYVDPALRALNQEYAVVTYTADGTIKHANYQFLRLVESELEEIVGTDASQFFSKTKKRAAQAQIWGEVANGQVVRDTRLWIAKYGTEIWLKSRFVPISDEFGEIDSVIQISEDISQQLKAETEHQGQINAIGRTQAVVHFSVDGRVLWANEIFLNALGYDHDEAVGQHHSLFVAPANRDSKECKSFWAALVGGQHQSGEFRCVAKDGSEVWLQAVYTPIYDPAGRLLKIVQYASVITEEKTRESSLQWQIDAIHRSNCVIIFDIYGTILEVNDKFLDSTGYTLDELVGRHHKMFVDQGEVHSAEYANFWNDLRLGKHRTGQYRRIGKDGREIWLQATYSPIFDTAGRPVKVVKFATDVTQDRLLQVDHQGQIAAIHRGQCVLSLDVDGTIVDANDNFLNAMGYRFADVRGQHHNMLVDPEVADSDDFRAFWEEILKGKSLVGEFKRLGKDGREVWLQATYNPIRDLSGKVFKVVKYATDVTEEKVRQTDYQGQITAINKSHIVAAFDLDGTILEVNDNFLNTLGYRRHDLVGRNHTILMEGADATSSENADFWRQLTEGAYHSCLCKRIGKNGKEVWIQASYNPILDPNGRPTKIVKYATDVSENVAIAKAFEEAKREARLDKATSLPNRTKLSSFMDSWLADSSATMAVFYLDLDGLKDINVNHGHHVGDCVLGGVADRLRRLIDENHLVARVGGDEFVIAAPGMSLESIERFCDELFDRISVPVRQDDIEIIPSLSVGIAVSPRDGTTPDDLLRAADTALNRSKQGGRGIHCYYASELNEKIGEQRVLVDQMRASLSAGDFYLEYQPRYDTRTKKPRSAEALVRWAHPVKGRVSPCDFIPIAEQSGLIGQLGDWVLQTACRTAVDWGNVGVSVNISPGQFKDETLIEIVKSTLEASGLRPKLLELEITESILLDDIDRAAEILKGLKSLGVRLEMDDFGTGYSSLGYLKSFPFDVIKMDRSFIRDLGEKKSALQVVQAIIRLARALGLSVTAEGVETRQQLELLAANQCDEVQGFFLSRPISPESFKELLEDKTSAICMT